MIVCLHPQAFVAGVTHHSELLLHRLLQASYYPLSTRADISFTVCVFVCLCVCLCGYGFLAEDKASGVTFCSAVHQCPRPGITIFCELCSPRSPKSDESASVQATPSGM